MALYIASKAPFKRLRITLGASPEFWLVPKRLNLVQAGQGLCDTSLKRNKRVVAREFLFVQDH